MKPARYTLCLVAGLLFLIFACGYQIHRESQRINRNGLRSHLRSSLNADVRILTNWLEEREHEIRAVSGVQEVRENAVAFLQVSENRPAKENPEAQRLIDSIDDSLETMLNWSRTINWVLLDLNGRVLTCGDQIRPHYTTWELPRHVTEDLMSVEGIVSLPFLSDLGIERTAGNLPQGTNEKSFPVMVSLTLLMDDYGLPIGAIGLLIDPTIEFTSLLRDNDENSKIHRYAFNSDGFFVTEAPHEDLLRDLGIFDTENRETSVLSIGVRDPGSHIANASFGRGHELARQWHERPLTRMAEDAIRSGTQIDLEGYRDYRGATVNGAWTWLADYQIGVASEIDVIDKHNLIKDHVDRIDGWIGICLLSVVGICLLCLRPWRPLSPEPVRANGLRKYGPYECQDLISAGGIGKVYRGYDHRLQRRVAIKVLEESKIDRQMMLRFEREIRATASLQHPNTIEIFDCGQGSDGRFYYVMELIDGMDLSNLVIRFGPQSPSRVVSILKQVAKSLEEAHAMGLVHRDIKPSNILLSNRPGMVDFVKVFDFGLVKEAAGGTTSAEGTSITQVGTLTGTPHYMAPEVVHDASKAEAHSDIYALGAVGFFLLTGQPVFSGSNTIDVCMKQLTQAPAWPAEFDQTLVPQSLLALIFRCLAKSPADRPMSAHQVLQELSCSSLDGRWGEQDATRWWANL